MCSRIPTMMILFFNAPKLMNYVRFIIKVNKCSVNQNKIILKCNFILIEEIFNFAV